MVSTLDPLIVVIANIFSFIMMVIVVVTGQLALLYQTVEYGSD